MKKFLLLTVSLLTVTILTAQTWVQKNNFPGVERYAATGFEINGKLYMGTGYNGVSMLNDWWEYNPATDQWIQKASFPGGARFHASSFAINGKGYVFFGSTSINPYNFPTDLWEYDPIANQWVQRANFPGQGRYTAVSLEINGKGYAGTGWKNSTFYNDWWEYNPISNAWLQKANLAGGTRQAAYGFTINNNGYVGLGSKTSTIFNDFYKYDPLTNSWSGIANFPSGSRSAGSSFAINGYGYIGTGVDGEFGTTIYSDYHKYDPITNSWTSINGFNPGRIGPVSIATSTCAYIISGKVTPPTNVPSIQNTLVDNWEICLATDISDISERLNNFNLYPNPTTNMSYLEFGCVKSSSLQIEIIDLTGKLISEFFEGKINKDKSYKFVIDNNLKTGIYLLKITLEDEIIYKQLVRLN